MSFAFSSNETQEYATRTEIHYMFKVSMARIAKEIRDGRLALHLIDNKIQISVVEARQVLGNPKTNRNLFR